MKVWNRIVSILDLFLSPEQRKMEMPDRVRVRFIVFAILFAIPCSFTPCLIFQSWNQGLVWILEGGVNLVVCLILLGALHKSRDYHRIAMLAMAWMHALFMFTLLAMPSIFSVGYFWSSCLVVISSLIFGMRGAFLSSLSVTAVSLANILYHHGQQTPWVTLTNDEFVEQLILQLLCSNLMTAAVAGVYEFMRDNRDRQQLQQRLIAARHAHTGAVGELVGHVAHEVNNPLAILQGSVTRLKRQLERNEWPHEAYKLLMHMQRSHERIIRVQQSLAVFASGNQHEPFISQDPRSILKDVERAMKPQAQAQQVRLEFNDLSLPRALRCQPHQLVYVLCSLIQNSLDACREHANPRIVVEVREAGSSLMISVSDNGKGIDPAVHDRVFQPFFTTKSSGTAQGLSLSVSRGILARHGGEIHFRSRPGATTFTCQIPREQVSSMPLAKGA